MNAEKLTTPRSGRGAAVRFGPPLLPSTRLAGADRQRHGKVSVSHAGRSEEKDVFLSREKRERGEIEDLGSIERRLEGEVEGVEALQKRKSRKLQRVFDSPLFASSDFFFE